MAPSETTTSSSASAPFPFDVVVITFPDAKAARSASKGPLENLRKAYPTTHILASCDPYQLRVGSGGGTLNALEEVLRSDQEQSKVNGDKHSLSSASLSVLILHAGGASSRCPTQMVLGKAWTSLPTKEGILMTPVMLWFQLAQKLFINLPVGSVVVIASDTLLDLADEATSGIHWEEMTSTKTTPSASSQHSAVVALSVPASLLVAKNHGVFVTPTNDDCSRSRVANCLQVFQKPTIEVLERECAFWHPHSSSGSAQERKAWIDTGVIVFLPEAAEALRSLLSDPATCSMLKCTQYGIRQAYNDTKLHTERQPLTFSQFAAQEAHSIDLYTHILNALQSPASLEDYIAKFQNELHKDVLAALYQALSPSRLLIWTVPSGSFLHLGTTKEMVQFLNTADHHRSTTPSVKDATNDLRISMAKSLGLVSTLNAIVRERGMKQNEFSGTFRGMEDSSILCESFFSAESVSVGEGSVVEHCFFNVKQELRIGKDCLLSGLRVDNAEHFVLDDHMMVQQVPLATGEFVFMILGLEDDIKANPCPLIHGKPVNDWLALAGLEADQVWPHTKSKSLWNAKIHPVCSSGESLAHICDYLLHRTNPHEKVAGATDDPVEHWKFLPKLSLAEIRHLAHAPSEFMFRAHLSRFLTNNPNPDAFAKGQQSMIELRRIAMSRHHAPIPIIEMLEKAFFDLDVCLFALRTMDEVIIDSYDSSKFDVCGRVWMLMNAVLDNLASIAANPNSVSVDDDQIHDFLLPLLGSSSKTMTVQEGLHIFVEQLCVSNRFSSSFDMEATLDKFAAVRDALLTNTRADLFSPSFVKATEKMAQTMIRLCVMGQINSIERVQPSPSKAVLNHWVLAASPARIDLAGGWSDTPPICFEYGSSVTGLAVLVDSLKPLSCRTRLSQRDSSILLMSEQRNSLGELISTEKVELQYVCDLRGFDDPSSQCALLKCALVVLGLADPEAISRREKTPMGSVLSELFGWEDSKLCLEVVVTSLLPHGSGMGSSSILAGCLLSSVGKCIGITFSTNPREGEHDVISAVISLEQMLGSGGGHQDQVNGLYPGAKITTCVPLHFPLHLEVDSICLSDNFISDLNENMVLVFTGKTRLAKNILQSCLRRFSARHSSIVNNVKCLCENALSMKDALHDSSLENVGSLLNTYWEQKKFMTGPDSGVEPETVTKICEALSHEKVVYGASLCGAGGGGFLALVKSKDVPLSVIEGIIYNSLSTVESESISTHSCTIAIEGLATRTLPGSVSSKDNFELSWLT